MALYIYPQPSPIDRLYVVKTDKGDYRAYLHASDSANGDLRKQVVEAMYQKRWQTVPTTHLDLPTLEVRGFGSPDELFEFLAEKKWVTGKAKQLPTPGDNVTFSDMLRQRTLQASGISYMIGDYGFFVYGLKGKNTLDTAAALAYAAGTWALAGFGQSNHAQLDIEKLTKQMATHLQQNKSSIPADLSLTRIAEDRPRSVLENTGNFLSTYPSEIFCAVTGLAGALVAAAAVQKYKAAPKHEQIEHLLDVGLGSITLASCTIGGLVKEKHRDPDEPLPEGTMEQIWEWIREKPLRLTGYGLMVSTMFHAVSTSKVVLDARKLPLGSLERQAKMDPILGRAQFVVCNLLAEFLMSISSKGHGEGVESDPSVERSMISVAAELIVNKPAEYREDLIKTMTKFLGDPKALGSKNSTVETDLRAAVQSALENPWAKDFAAQQAETSARSPESCLASKTVSTAERAPSANLAQSLLPHTLAKMPAHAQQRLATLPALDQQHKPA